MSPLRMSLLVVAFFAVQTAGAADLTLTETSGLLTGSATGTLAGTGEASGDEWRFNVEAGDTLTVWVSTDEEVWPRLKLFDPSDIVRAQASWDGVALVRIQTLDVPVPGSYRLVIFSDYGPSNYRVRVDIGRSCQLETEYNDTQSYANNLRLTRSAGSCQAKVAGALYGASGESDFFRLPLLSPGNSVAVTPRFPSGSTLDANSLEISLELEGGAVLATHNGTFFNYNVVSNGVHYLRVTSTNGSLQAQYQLSAVVVDGVAPSVLSVNLPAEGATSDAVIDRFTVTFSEFMDPTTVSNLTYTTLRSAGPDDTFGTADDETYALTVNYNGQQTADFLAATGPLQPGARYRVTLGAGLRDLSGNALAPPLTRTFRVISLPPFVTENRANNSPAGATSLKMNPPTSPDGTFSDWAALYTGSRPYGLAIADMNKDGRPDLISSSYYGDSINVLLGAGDGMFMAATNYPAAGYPRGIAIGDFDRNGWPDVAVARELADNIGVLLNRGDGTLGPAITAMAGDAPAQLATADINADGKLDLLAPGFYDDSLTVDFGFGDGTFSALSTRTYREIRVPTNTFSRTGTPQNWKADDYSWTLPIPFEFPFFGRTYTQCFVDSNGRVAFDALGSQTGGDVSALSSHPMIAVMWRDLRTDGEQNGLTNDVYVSTNASEVVIRWQGRFYSSGTPVNMALKLQSNGVIRLSYGPGNVNSDSGFIGLGAGDGVSYQVSTASHSAGMENVPDIVFMPQPPAALVSQRYTVGDGPRDVLALDLDRDTRPDVAVTQYNNDNIRVLTNVGGILTNATDYAAGDGTCSLATGDFNADGIPDLVAANELSDDLSVFLGQGNGAFLAQVRYAAGDSPLEVAVADVNADGKPDLLCTLFNPDRISVLLGKGDGTFDAANEYAAGDGPSALVVGDLNSDGRQDVAVTDAYSDRINLLVGNRQEILAEDPAGSGLRSGQGRGNLADTSDLDCWSFRGEAGDALTLAVEVPGTPSYSGLRYDLYSPSGVWLTGFYGEWSTGVGQIDGYVLPASGRYTVRVSYNYAYWGEYRIRATLASPPMQMESENNDATNSADRLTFAVSGGRQQATVAGYLSTVDAKGDLFSLGNLSSGTVVTVTLNQPATSPLAPLLELLDAAGRPVGTGANRVLHLNGGGDSLKVNSFTNFPTTAITAEFWMRTDDANNAGSPLSYASETGGDNDFLLYDYRNFAPHIIGAYWSTGIAANDGRWHHIACSWDSVTGDVRFYKDATLVATTTSWMVGYTFGPGGALVLGQEQDEVGGGYESSQAFVGDLDNVRIWNVVRTPAQLSANLFSNLSGNEPGLAALWDFDAGTAADRSPQHNNGVLEAQAGIVPGDRPAAFGATRTNLSYTTVSSGEFYVRVMDVAAAGGLLNQYRVSISLRDSNLPYVISVGLPPAGATVTSVVDRFTLTFSEEMRVATVTNPANYELLGAGPDNAFGTTDDLAYRLGIEYTAGLTATLIVQDGPLRPGRLRFTARAEIQDRAGSSMAEAFTHGPFTLAAQPGFILESRNNGTWASATPLWTGAGRPDGTLFIGGDTVVGSYPQDLAVADFDADGKQDLAVAVMNEDRVAILRGSGDGTFTTGASLPAGDGCRELTVGDFNRDGRPDLATGNGNVNFLSVFLNNGGGTFAPATNYWAGGSPWSLVSADLNNDGNADLVSPSEWGDCVYVLLGSSNGVFSAAASHWVGDGPYGLAIGDFNEDGKPDVMAVNRFGSTLGLLRGNGDGTFAVATNRPIQGSTFLALAAADVNRDGHLDVAVASYGDDTARVFLGAGNGTFTDGAVLTVGDAPYDVQFVDLNQDARLDLVTADFSGATLSYAYGRGDGTFETPRKWGTGSGPIRVASGDFNSDSRPDVVVANYYSGTIRIFLSNASEFPPENPAGSRLFAAQGCGNLSGTSDEDYWSFTHAAGATFTVAAQVPGNPSQSGLLYDIYDSGGIRVGGFYAGVNGYGQSDPIRDIPAGRCFVRVSRNYNYFGEYRLSVFEVRAPVQMEDEENARPADANVLVFAASNYQQRATIAGFISTADADGDYYKLGNLVSGTVVNVSMRKPADSPLAGRIELLDANGIPLFGGSSSNGVLSLDGDGDYLDAPDAVWFKGDFTIEAWVYPRTFPSWARILDFANGASSDNVLFTMTQGGNGVPLLSLYGDTGNVDLGFPSALPAYEWTHLAVTLNGRTARAYRNGEEVASIANAPIPRTLVRTANYIGRSNWSWDGYANGALDDVRIWNRALSRAEIRQFMGSRPPAAHTNLLAWWGFDAGTAADASTNRQDGTFAGNARVVYSPVVDPTVPAETLSHTVTQDGVYYIRVRAARPDTAGLLSRYLLDASMYDSTLPTVTDVTLPAEGASVTGVIDRFTLRVTEELNVASMTRPASCDLRAAGPDGRFETPDDVPYTLSVSYSGGLAAEFTVTDGPLQPGAFRFLTSTSITDRTGTPLIPYTRTFRLDRSDTYQVEDRDNNTPQTADPLHRAVTNRPDGAYALLPQPLDRSAPRGLVAGRFNADTNLDLAAAAAIPQVFLGDGAGRFTAVPSTVSPSETAIVSGDWNGDGRPDLAVALAGPDQVAVLLNQGDGRFTASANVPVGLTPESLAVARLDGDTNLDLLVGNLTGHSFTALLGNGNGTFRTAGTTACGGAEPRSVAAADLDGDGRTDAIVAERDSDRLSLWKGAGDGTFTAWLQLATGDGPVSVVAQDFNFDGRIDLACANEYADTLSVFVQTAAGAFGDKVDLPVGYRPVWLTVLDADRDGSADLAVANAAGHSVSLLLGNGYGSFSPQIVSLAGLQPVCLAAGDFNNDGWQELAVSCATDNRIVLLGALPTVRLPQTPARAALRSAAGRGTIQTGDQDYWTFWGQAGDGLCAALETYGISGGWLRLMLYRPDDNSVFYLDAWTRNYAQSSPITLPVSGRYLLLVSPYSGFTGEYRFRLASATLPAALEQENNDAVAQANAPGYASGAGRRRTLVAGFMGEGNTVGDYFKIGELSRDATLDLSVILAPGNPLAPELSILNAAGTVLATGVAGATNLVYVTQTNAVYFACIRGSQTGVDTLYQLQAVVSDTTQPTVTGTSLPDEGRASDALINAFTLRFSEDMRAETVTAADSYRLAAAGADGALGTADDLVYPLQPAAYTPGQPQELALVNGPLQPGLCRFTALRRIADGMGNPMAEDFVRTFTLLGAPGFVTEGRANDRREDATPVRLTEDPAGLQRGGGRGFLPTAQDADWYSFSARAGQSLVLGVETPGAVNSSRLRYTVRDAAGVALSGLDFVPLTGTGRGQSAPVTVASNSLLYVQVSREDAYAGEYRFCLTLAAAPFTAESEENGSLAQADDVALVTAGSTNLGTVAGVVAASGDLDYFRLGAAVSGKSILLGVRQPASNSAPFVVSVYNSSNAYQAEAPGGRSDDGAAEVRITTDGVYYGVVRSAQGGLLGQYLLDVMILPTGDLLIPNLRVASCTLPAGSIRSGQSVTFSYSVTNAGSAATAAGTWLDRVVLSANTVLGDGDDTALGLYPHNGDLAPGATYTATPTVRLPEGIQGSFHLIVFTDYARNVDERAFEGDNSLVSPDTFAVARDDYADLRVEALSATGADEAGSVWRVEWRTANRGTRAVAVDTADRVRVRNLTQGLTVLEQSVPVAAPLAAQQFVSHALSFTGGLAGAYEIAVTADARNDVFEFDADGHESAEQNTASTNATLYNYYSVQVFTNPVNGGTVSGGAARLRERSVVTVQAAVRTNLLPFTFVNWTEYGQFRSASTSYTFMVTENRRLTANFALPMFRFDVEPRPPEGGTVSGAGLFAYASTNVLRAYPNPGYRFVRWVEGAATAGTNLSLAIPVFRDRSLAAVFEERSPYHVLTIATQPPGVAAIPGSGRYTNGVSVTITAPAMVTNATMRYIFSRILLNGQPYWTTNSFTRRLTTLDPTNMNLVAEYTSLRLRPQVRAVQAGYNSPVPATTNYQITVWFDRSMDPAVLPRVALSNTVSGLVRAFPDGQWLAADTYRTRPLAFASGADGVYSTLVSRARDTYGSAMAAAAVLGVTVNSTPPPVPSISVTASNPASVTVGWPAYTAPADLNGFRLYRTREPFTSVEGLAPRVFLSPRDRAFTMWDVETDAQYYLAVTAVDEAGNVIASVTGMPLRIASVIPPPVAIRVQVVGADAARISWEGYDASALFGFTGFRLYRQTAGFNSVAGLTAVTSLTAEVRSLQMPGLSRTNTHYFAVVGVNRLGQFNPAVTARPWSDPYAGAITNDLTLGGQDQRIVIYRSMMVTNNAMLRILPGTTLAFKPGAGLTVGPGRLVAEGTALRPIVLTSAQPMPAPGDWAGVRLGPDAGASVLTQVRVEYGAGIRIQGCNPRVEAPSLEGNAPCGLDLAQGAVLTLNDALVRYNAIGVLQRDTARLTLGRSILYNNATNAAVLDGGTLVATNNWWSDTTLAPIAARVAGNVTVSPFLSVEPLLTPAFDTRDGERATGERQLGLRFGGRAPESMRVSEDSRFSGVFFQPFAPTGSVQLSEGGGLKTLYVQFRTATGSTNSAPITLAVRYITEGPQIQAFNLVEGQRLERPYDVVGQAVSALGLASVEFSVDDRPVATTNASPLRCRWDLRGLASGAHRVKLLARDTRGNLSSSALNVFVNPVPPPAPAITNLPASMLAVSNAVSVSGTAEPGIGVRLLRNGTVMGSATATQAGRFEFQGVRLEEGQNEIVAVAFDTLGSARSQPRMVILDTGAPTPVTLEVEGYVPGVGLKLSWRLQEGAGETPSRYRVYRHTAAFTRTNEASEVSAPLTRMSLATNLPADRTWFFGVAGFDEAGNASPLSNVLSFDYDATPPAFGVGFDKSSPVGQGPLRVILSASETLSAAPSLVLTPSGGRGPVMLVLSNSAPQTYEGVFNINRLTPSGTAGLEVSARDLKGNVFTGAPTGSVLVIDTTAPSGRIEVAERAPVQTLSNRTVLVRLALSEPAKPGTTPRLTFRPPAGPVVELGLSGGGADWNAPLELNPLMGAGFGVFQLTVRDAVDNEGTTLTAGDKLEIYNSLYPSAPAAVTQFMGGPLTGGVVELVWYPVQNAEEYKLYREPGFEGGAPATLVRSGITSNVYRDLPPQDGHYRYAVTASRRGADSEFSAVVRTYSDRTPPLAPTNVTATLGANGLLIQWGQPDGGDPAIRYKVYRNADLLGTYTPNVRQVTDHPRKGSSSYTVAAEDFLGNRAVSAPAVFEMRVAAVDRFEVLLHENEAPRLSWTSTDPEIRGFNLYRNGVKLNPAPLTQTSFTDTNYSGTAKTTYAVRALNAAGSESPARVGDVFRGFVDLAVNADAGAPGAPMTRYFDVCRVSAANQTVGSAWPLRSVELRRTAADNTVVTVTDAFEQLVTAGSAATNQTVLPSLSDIQTQDVRVRLFQDTGDPGTDVIYQRLFRLPSAVKPTAMLEVIATNRPVVGAMASVDVRIFNRSRTTMDVVLVTGNGSGPGDVYVVARNSLEGEVSRADFQGTAPGLRFTPDGRGYVRIDAGRSLSVSVSGLMIPEALAAEGGVLLEARVSKVYHDLGGPEQCVSGPLNGTLRASLRPPPYVGTVATDRPVYVNDQKMRITGRALDSATGAAVTNAKLRVGFALQKYQWYEEVVTDATGAYRLDYTLPPVLSGTLWLWAAHPSVVDRLDDLPVGVYRLIASPGFADIRMSKNDTLALSVNLYNPALEEAAGGFTARVRAYRMDGTNEVPIQTVTGRVALAEGFAIEPGGQRKVDLSIVTAVNAPDRCVVDFTITDAAGASATLKATLTLLEAVPLVTVTDPAVGYVELSVDRGRIVSRDVTIVNRGVRDLQGVEIVAPTNYPWIVPTLPRSADGRYRLPDLAIGASHTFTIACAPPESLALGDYAADLLVTGTNHPSPFKIGVYPLVTSDRKGAVQFYVENTLGSAVTSATVRLRSSALMTELPPVRTDTRGLVTVPDLQEGFWNWQISAPGHGTMPGMVEVLPGQTVRVEPRLDKSLVTVTFRVEPVPFTDKYEIKIEQTFETHVPAPVLILEPTYREFSGDGGPMEVAFTATARNEGLISLDNVEITDFELSYGKMVPAIRFIPSLRPFETVQIPYSVEYYGGDMSDTRSGAQRMQRQETAGETAAGFADCMLGGFGEMMTAIHSLIQFASRVGGEYYCVNDPTAAIGAASGLLVMIHVINFAGTYSGVVDAVANAVMCLGQAVLGPAQGKPGEFGRGGDFGFGGAVCFVGDTPVLMADGTQKTIETVAKGDVVRTGLRSGDVAQVIETKVQSTTRARELTVAPVDGPATERSVVTTDEHLFWVDGKGWTAAARLAAGDALFTSDGGRARVTASESVPMPLTVYSLQLLEDNAFYANGILTHDQCGVSRQPKDGAR